MATTRDDLTEEQAEALADGLFPTFNYMYRLKTRMEKKGFKPSDPLFKKVIDAYQAVHHRMVEVRHVAADGVGRPSQPNHPKK